MVDWVYSTNLLTTSPLRYCTTTLVHHCCSLPTLLHHFTTSTLLHHFTTITLLHHFTTITLLHNFATSQLRYFTTSLPLLYFTTSLLHHCATSPLCYFAAFHPSEPHTLLALYFAAPERDCCAAIITPCNLSCQAWPNTVKTIASTWIPSASVGLYAVLSTSVNGPRSCEHDSIIRTSGYIVCCTLRDWGHRLHYPNSYVADMGGGGGRRRKKSEKDMISVREEKWSYWLVGGISHFLHFQLPDTSKRDRWVFQKLYTNCA